MADLFFAYDGPNYSRYFGLAGYILTNIDKSHPDAKELLEKGGIAVARSLLPGALSAVDKTIEETFMKSLKSAVGLMEFCTFLVHTNVGAELHPPEHNILKKYWKCAGLLKTPSAQTEASIVSLKNLKSKKLKKQFRELCLPSEILQIHLKSLIRAV